MIDLNRVPPCVAHAVEAHGRAEHAVANRAHWREDYERLVACLAPEHVAQHAEILSAMRRGVEVRPRTLAAPRERPPLAPAGARINGTWH